MAAQTPGENESAREQLLASARSLVLERFGAGVAPHHALAYLTPATVAAHAGVSRGTIYHHWGQGDGDDRPFERFLAEVATSFWEDSVAVDDLDALAALLPDNLSDLVLELTAFELERLTAGDGAAMFRASTTMALHGVDLSERFQGSVEQLSTLYAAGLTRLGRRLREPLTALDLARAMASLTGGMLLADLLDPGQATRPIEWSGHVPAATSERAWTIFAVAAESLLLNMTEPNMTEPGGTAPPPGA